VIAPWLKKARQELFLRTGFPGFIPVSGLSGFKNAPNP
jgi:hypothetical protein